MNVLTVWKLTQIIGTLQKRYYAVKQLGKLTKMIMRNGVTVVVIALMRVILGLKVND